MEIARSEGMSVGLVKIKSIRPFPEKEIKALARNTKAIIVPEFNRSGWLAREIKSVVEDPTKIVAGPRVFGGMTMPKELIINEIRRCSI